jgi:hypothetical protein
MFYVDNDAGSGVSKKSNASRMSYKSRLAAEKAKENDTKSQWNDSVSTAKRELTAEDKLAQRIA